MKQLSLIILLVSITFCSRGQDKTDTAQTEYESANSFAVRGKFWPWILLFTGVQMGVGVEYGFDKKYSVALQAEYGYMSFPNDSGEHIGPRMKQIYKSASLTFKRYLRPTFYVAAFSRFGTFHFDIEKGYRTDTISYHQSQYSVGALVGFVKQADRRILYELNFGLFIKKIYVHDVYHQDNIIIDKRFN